MKKKMNKTAMRKFILMSVVLLLLIIPSTVNAFSDVNQSDWFYGNITTLKSRGIVNGYADNTFRPAANVSHGESLKMLTMLNESDIPDERSELPVRAQNPIKHQNHWAEKYIQAAMNDKILQLKSNGLSYDKKATRTETAIYILSYINAATDSNIAPLDIKMGSFVNSDFADAYGEGLDFLYGSEIIKGTPVSYGKNEFQGDRNVTRAEFSAMMDRAERVILRYKMNEDPEQPIQEVRPEPVQPEPVIPEPVRPEPTRPEPVKPETPKNPYSMINNVRTINIPSVKPYTHNNFELKNYIKAIYYMQYHNFENLVFTYSPEHYSKIITDGQLRPDYLEEIRVAYRYVSGSYPELFFTENRLSFSAKSDSSGVTITFSLSSPTFTRAEVINRRNVFEEKTMKEARRMLDEGIIKEGMSEFEIAGVLHDWTVSKIEYDYDFGPRSYDGYSGLIDGKAVCNGYSSLLHRMMSLFGIEVVGTTGIANNELHIWGEAMLDGQKYYIDPTWNDAYGYKKLFTTDINILSADRTWDKSFFDGYRYLID